MAAAAAGDGEQNDIENFVVTTINGTSYFAGLLLLLLTPVSFNCYRTEKKFAT